MKKLTKPHIDSDQATFNQLLIDMVDVVNEMNDKISGVRN